MQIKIKIGLLSFKHNSLDEKGNNWFLAAQIYYIYLLTTTAFSTLFILYINCSFLFKLFHKI
jgi:uncharacterized membrane protein